MQSGGTGTGLTIDLGFGLQPELDVATRGAAVLFPQFPRAGLDPMSPSASVLPLLKHAFEFIDPRCQSLICRAVADTHRDPARLLDLARELFGVIVAPTHELLPPQRGKMPNSRGGFQIADGNPLRWFPRNSAGERSPFDASGS
jgi:hypothetical protein